MSLKFLLNIQTIRLLFIKKIKDYNPNEKCKILFFGDMIADMLSNEKRNPILTKLFITSRKLNIFLLFITQS